MVILGKRYLISDRNIAALSKKERVFEHDFIDAVRGFNLRDALIAIGRASLEIHLSKSPFKVGRAALKDPSTSVIVTQHSLAYIANILIISGANDFKNKRLKVRDDLLSLCNIYYCSIVEPLLQEDENSSDQEQLRSFLIRMYVEQMELQFSPAYMIARTVLLFNHIANRVPPTRFPPLNEIMLEEAGISLFDYLRMGAISFSLLSKQPTLNIHNFTTAIVPELKLRLTEERVRCFINILCADYQRFRETDSLYNQGLEAKYTKNRFNPLYIYPIAHYHVSEHLFSS